MVPVPVPDSSGGPVPVPVPVEKAGTGRFLVATILDTNVKINNLMDGVNRILVHLLQIHVF